MCVCFLFISPLFALISESHFTQNKTVGSQNVLPFAHFNSYLSLRQNADFDYLRTESWGEYLNLRARAWQDDGENYIIKSFEICPSFNVVKVIKSRWISYMTRAVYMRRDEERNAKLSYKLRCRGLFRKSSHLGTYKNEKIANILPFDSTMNIIMRSNIYWNRSLGIIKMEPKWTPKSDIWSVLHFIRFPFRSSGPVRTVGFAFCCRIPAVILVTKCPISIFRYQYYK